MSEANIELVKGIFAVQSMAHAWREWLGAFDEFSVVGQAFHDAGDKVVVEQLFRGKGKGSGVPVDEVGGCVFTVRDGTVIRIEGHTTLEGALASAGIAD